MSWHFSRGQVEAYLQADHSDGGPFVQLRLSRSVSGYSCNDKTTENSRNSRYGTTLKHLTGVRGEALLTSYLAGFRAKTSALPEKARVSKVSVADCGESLLGSFAKYDRDTCSWRTHQYSLLGGLELYSETWPRWGSMRNGACWQRPRLGRRINVKEFGSWLIPTPTCHPDAPNKNANTKGPKSLTEAAKTGYTPVWQTPAADDAINRKQGKWNSRGEPKLSAQVILWLTPTVSGNHNRKGASKTSGDGLATKVKMFPTPCATDYKGSGRTGQLRDRLDYAAERGATKSKSYEKPAVTGGKLNPMWVEWLMGWPIGWTDLKPSATGKCHNALRKRSDN